MRCVNEQHREDSRQAQSHRGSLSVRQRCDSGKRKCAGYDVADTG